jgi:lipoprotein signal peptidase
MSLATRSLYRRPLVVIAGVVGIDQVSKAVQHANQFVVNTGGAAIVPSSIGDFLWRSPHIGAVADTAAAAGLFAAVRLSGCLSGASRRVAAALVVGGLSSNLLDRLGFASLVHPGLPRGSIDWVPLGSHLRANLADAFIALGTALLLAVGVTCTVRKVLRRRPLSRTSKLALLLALLIWTSVWGANRHAAVADRQDVLSKVDLAALCRDAYRYPSIGVDWLSWSRPLAASSVRLRACAMERRGVR